MKGKLLYWKMVNGHEHSFMAYTDDILSEYAIENEKGELSQKQYQEYIENHEHTTVEEEIIEEFTELTEDLAQEWLNKDYIADFEVDDEEIIIEFY